LKLSDLVKKSLDPLVNINLAGMAVGAIWLVYRNRLGAAWPGVLGLVLSPVIFPMLLIPAAFFAGMMTILEKSNKLLEALMKLLSVLYLITMMSFYEVLMFYFLTGSPEKPASIYAVAAGVAPWAALARQDRDNLFFTGLILMMQVSAIVLVVFNETFRLKDFDVKFLIIWSTMVLLVTIQALYEKLVLERKLARTPAETPAVPEKPAETK
jgi:hypothetical protein